MEGLNDLLTWLTGIEAGAFVVVSVALAWALEDVNAWQQLSSKLKALAVLAGASALAIGSTALAMNQELVAAIDPWFRPLAKVLLAWLATQGAHYLNPKRAENVVKSWSKDPGGGYQEVG